jgi:N-acetylglutamate synthase-like GNAT family acetyltransferase
MQLRKATVEEVDALNDFIRASKAVWGYSEEFLDAYMQNWGLTKESLEKKSVKVIEDKGEIHGIFCLGTTKKKKIALHLFFVNPKFIKTGVGRKMWGMIHEYARANKWKGFEIIADPNAEKFFHRMGAITTGTVESLPGMHFPILKYELTPTLKIDRAIF